jgi:hypothetical protein
MQVGNRFGKYYQDCNTCIATEDAIVTQIRFYHVWLLSCKTVTGSSTREHAKNCVLRGDYAHDGDVAAASLCFNINIKVVTKGCDDSAELYASFAPEGGKVTAPTMTLLYKHIPGTNIGHYDLVFTTPATAVCVGTSGCRQQQHQAAAAACVFKPCVSQAPAESD